MVCLTISSLIAAAFGLHQIDVFTHSPLVTGVVMVSTTMVGIFSVATIVLLQSGTSAIKAQYVKTDFIMTYTPFFLLDIVALETAVSWLLWQGSSHPDRLALFLVMVALVLLVISALTAIFLRRAVLRLLAGPRHEDGDRHQYWAQGNDGDDVDDSDSDFGYLYYYGASP